MLGRFPFLAALLLIAVALASGQYGIRSRV